MNNRSHRCTIIFKPLGSLFQIGKSIIGLVGMGNKQVIILARINVEHIGAASSVYKMFYERRPRARHEHYNGNCLRRGVTCRVDENPSGS